MQDKSCLSRAVHLVRFHMVYHLDNRRCLQCLHQTKWTVQLFCCWLIGIVCPLVCLPNQHASLICCNNAKKVSQLSKVYKVLHALLSIRTHVQPACGAAFVGVCGIKKALQLVWTWQHSALCVC